ncbi:MAG: Rossmann-like and DUF2520 domain-containing protein [Bacteroidota bacterium]|jgi:predicted short-subunit dehydrogenase-like oxidoreductase (DUF2520 family)
MRIFIIGSGRMANALAPNLIRAGHQITGIHSRNSSSGHSLAKHLACPFFTTLQKTPSSELIIITVTDDATGSIAKLLSGHKALIAHTSGSVSIDKLGRKKNAGVFYPMETLTGNRKTDFTRIPVCVEATDEKSLGCLLKVAHSISEEVYVMDSHTRKALHMAAVFTNNFTNHLLGIAHDLAKKHGFPFGILEKLARSTIKNAFAKDPHSVQTGPARRNDQATIKKHLSMLKGNPSAKSIYKNISEAIQAVQNKRSR